MEGVHLLAAMAAASGVFYNYTHDLPCFDFKAGANKETEEDSDFWGYQSCTEQWMPMSRDGGMTLQFPFQLAMRNKPRHEQWKESPVPTLEYCNYLTGDD